MLRHPDTKIELKFSQEEIEAIIDWFESLKQLEGPSKFDCDIHAKLLRAIQ